MTDLTRIHIDGTEAFYTRRVNKITPTIIIGDRKHLGERSCMHACAMNVGYMSRAKVKPRYKPVDKGSLTYS